MVFGVPLSARLSGLVEDDPPPGFRILSTRTAPGVSRTGDGVQGGGRRLHFRIVGTQARGEMAARAALELSAPRHRRSHRGPAPRHPRLGGDRAVVARHPKDRRTGLQVLAVAKGQVSGRPKAENRCVLGGRDGSKDRARGPYPFVRTVLFGVHRRRGNCSCAFPTADMRSRPRRW